MANELDKPSRSPGGNGALNLPQLTGGLEDAYRQPVDPLKRPADPELIYRDIPSVPVTEWTPNLIRVALADHMTGIFRGSALLSEATLSDPRVQATLDTRCAALFGRTIRFRPANDSDAARECFDAWVDTFDHSASRSALSMILRWGVMLRFCPIEIQWDTTATPWCPYLKLWHPEFFYYNIVTRYYVAFTVDGPMDVTPGDGKWMLYTPDGAYRGWVNGKVRAVAVPWLVRQYATRDWARYSEVHGNPIMKASVPAMGDAEQKRRFRSALANLGRESVVVTPKGVDGQDYDLNLLEAVDKSGEAFAALMDRCDMSIVLALLGQNLTTEVKEGSFAAARVHGDVRQDLLEGDNQSLALTIYEQLARPFALFNFGDPELAVWTEWDVSPVEDREGESRAMVQFASALQILANVGFPVDVEKLARWFDIPIRPGSPSPIELKASTEKLPMTGAGGGVKPPKSE